MHHRSLLRIAFAAIGVTYVGGARNHDVPRDRGHSGYDHDEDWIAPMWFGSDDGQNGDGGA